MGDKGTILVTGATGHQGGAATRRLLRQGWRVRALTRNPDSEAARSLAQQGADVVTGEMDDRDLLDVAMRDVHGVFSVQPTQGGQGTPDGYSVVDEVRLGIAVAEAALRADVRHLVYSSVAGAERGSGIRKWESKWQVEQRIAELGVPATILRPVRFMENHFSPVGGIKDGILTDVFEPDTGVQMIAVEDIGVFVQLAFDDPDLYLGQAIEIAGDELTMRELVASIGTVIARPIEYRKLPLAAAERIGGDALAGYAFVNGGGGWNANIPALRAHHPELLTHDRWLTGVGAPLVERFVERSR